MTDLTEKTLASERIRLLSFAELSETAHARPCCKRAR